jgi:hypothetical protein
MLVTPASQPSCIDHVHAFVVRVGSKRAEGQVPVRDSSPVRAEDHRMQ